MSKEWRRRQEEDFGPILFFFLLKRHTLYHFIHLKIKLINKRPYHRIKQY